MRIGKVDLDETYYGGKDLYSDGDVEEEMLHLSEEGKDVYQILKEKPEWAFLYHFSPLREQILSWFPFTQDMDVLEIGSGCGAVTGALLGKVRSVTSVDLSMRRSKINANRHREAEGLRIVVGNFQDAEKNLGMYDVITLIGVFEYGRSYIGGERPYLTFLQTIKRHLRPGGRIFIAIENRFGLKYWAGCTEDHSGRLFEGLEGYLQEGSAKTFTKKELTELAE
ncbi:MAG: class I SAM-dependent methyltransferase, partial [Blautia sp.]|nr:class I SAM-dependent methyltransferase [Blautia sp.]